MPILTPKTAVGPTRFRDANQCTPSSMTGEYSRMFLYKVTERNVCKASDTSNTDK